VLPELAFVVREPEHNIPGDTARRVGRIDTQEWLVVLDSPEPGMLMEFEVFVPAVRKTLLIVAVLVLAEEVVQRRSLLEPALAFSTSNNQYISYIVGTFFDCLSFLDVVELLPNALFDTLCIRFPA